MQPRTTSSNINVIKISDTTVKANQAQALGPTPTPGPTPVPGPFQLTCGAQFRLGAKPKTNPVPATVTMVPHGDSKYNTSTLPETAVTFKTVDAALNALVAEWNIAIPDNTVAYATFSKVLFLDDHRDAIFFVTSKGINRLYLKRPAGTHVFYSDGKAVYCRKSKLFVLDSDGYSMFVDFGV